MLRFNIEDNANKDKENETALREFSDVNVFFEKFDSIFEDRNDLVKAYDCFIEKLQPYNLDYTNLELVIMFRENDVTFFCISKKFISSFLNDYLDNIIVRVSDVIRKLTN